MEDLPWLIQFLTYGIYFFSMGMSYLREYGQRLLRLIRNEKTEIDIDKKNGYAPICNENHLFFEKWGYRRMEDLFNRPVKGLPGAWIDVMVREGDPMENVPLKISGKTHRCLNLGSYNYLGFAENDTNITEEVINSLQMFGVSCVFILPLVYLTCS